MKRGKNVAIFFGLFLVLAGVFTYAINTWDKRLTTMPSTNPYSIMDNEGNIYVVWEGYESSNGIYYKFYNVTTSTWSNDTLIISGNNKKPVIAIGDGIYIAWENESSKAIKFAEIDEHGNIISSIMQLDSIPSKNVSIAAHGSEIYFVWQHNGSVFYEMYNMTSSQWFDETLLENNSFMPFILYNTLEKIMQVIYTTNESGNNEIHYIPLHVGGVKTSYDSDGDGLYDSVEKGWTNYSNSSYDDSDAATTTDWQDYDTDDDGLPDGWIDGWSYDSHGYWGINYSRIDGIKQPWEGEDLNLNGAVNTGETDPNSYDSDNDGLPDGWEVWYGLNGLDGNGDDGANGDVDNDGLTNMQEYENGTSPVSNDSDNDGLLDKYEIEHGTDANNPDSDNDGLFDGEENFTLDVDNDGLIPPLDNDSDNDGIEDGNEYYVYRYLNPFYFSYNYCTPFDDPDSDGLIDMLDADSDNDGLNDSYEFSLHTDPTNADSDGDGVSDYDEVNGRYCSLYGVGWITTDPNNADSDNDGLWDGNFTRAINKSTGRMEVYPGEWNAGWAGANPLDNDTDDDGLPDGLEVFGWNISVKEYGDMCYEKYVHSDPYSPDSDGDGLNDSYEYEHGLDPSSTDTDNDGLNDGVEELSLHTDPNNPDSDNDGVCDGTEYLRGTNMSNPDTDNDGLPDSEGDWIVFRTNAEDVNNGSIIREEFNFGKNLHGDAFYDYGELRYSASRIVNVTIYYTEKLRIPLQERPPGSTLNENEYWWWNASEYAAHGGDGWTAFLKVGYNLTKDDDLEVNYSADYGFAIFNRTGYINPTDGVIPINNGSTWYGTDFKVGDNWGTYDTLEIYNVTLLKLNHTRKHLIESSYPPDYDHFNYSKGENKIIIKHNSNNPATKIVVYYVASSAIDYSSPLNDNSWVAIDTEFYLNKNLLPFGRVDGVTLKDEQIAKMHSVAHTAEGYPVYYNDKPSIFPIKRPLLLNTMEAVSWAPSGEYALVSGNGYAYLYHKNSSIAEFSLPLGTYINSIDWDSSGKYAIMVGNNGAIFKFDYSNRTIAQIASNTTRNLYGVAFSTSEEYAVAVGNGTILSINAENNSVTNVTLSSSLGGTGYVYKDVACINNIYFFIITSDGRAFVCDVWPSTAMFDKEIVIFPKPESLIACDWKHGFDETLGKYIDYGVITGYDYTTEYGVPVKRWNAYIVDYNSNYHIYTGKTSFLTSPFTFTDVVWHPNLPEAIITAKDTNSGWGHIFTLDLKTGYLNRTTSFDCCYPNGIDFESHGEYAIVAGYGDPMVLGYIYPYVTIDVPGNYNPVYMDRFSCSVAREAKYAETGRGSIIYRFNNGQETKNDLMLTDPLNPSTLNDGMLDGDRFKLGFEDSDHDGTPNFLDRDADNDGILNGEEAYPLLNFDNDSLMNALDNDSDNDSVLDGDEVRVVYRSNYNGSFNTSIWIGVEMNTSNNKLEEYWYSAFDGMVTINSSNATLHPINYTLLGIKKQIHTPEGYPLYYSNDGYVYIDIPGPKMAKFVQGNEHIPDNSTSLNPYYASRHQETYNGTAMLSNDSDNDGLPDSIDPEPNNPDVDGDGIKDGYEYRWNESIDDDGLPDYNDVDSDNDGLPDGWIDGWGYNTTAAELHIHYNGTIDGWGIWYSKDGIKQPWEGEDLNCDSKTDENETNFANDDTDNDGFMDGDEVGIYHTDAINGGDADGDGLSDYDEKFGFFPVDTIYVVKYMNESRDTITKFSDGWRGITPGMTVSVKIPVNATYRIWTEPAGASIEINGSSSSNADASHPLEVTLIRGIYNVSIASSNYISRLVIAKQGCNMTNPDSDGDGIPDGAEQGSPLDPDSDNDGLLDDEEQIPYYNMFHEYLFSYTVSSPTDMDSDLDGVSDKNDPSRLSYSYLSFNHHTYPIGSIMENKTFRGWGLDGHSWIIYRWGSVDDRGRKDVKVSNMSDLEKVKENIIKTLPEWYDIYPNSISMEGDALNSNYNDTWEFHDFTGYPLYRIRYYYIAKLYNVTLYNNQTVYRYENGEIGTEEKPHFRYALFDVYVKDNRAEIMIIKYSLPSSEDEHYFVDEYHYKIPAFEYKIYSDTATGKYVDSNNRWHNGSVVFDSYPMQRLFLIKEGFVTPTEIESTPMEKAYSIKIPIPANHSGKIHVYLSPVYVVRNGSCSRDKSVIPWNIDSIKVAGIEKILPSYSYRVISKLSENITDIDSKLPDDFQNYSTGWHNIEGYNIYVYHGSPDDFVFDNGMLAGDAIAIISTMKQDVDKITAMINFTSDWYYNVSSVFAQNMTMKEYKTIIHSKVNYYTYSWISQLGIWWAWGCEDEEMIDKNITGIVKHNNSLYNYTISYTRKIVDSSKHERIIHIVKDQNNSIDAAKTMSDSKYDEVKNIFSAKPDSSMLSTDDSFIMVVAPHKQADGSIVMELFSYASSAYSLGTGGYGALKTFKELRNIEKITDPVEKAAKINKFMTPEVGKLEVIDFAISAIDLSLTWYNAYNANDKFITRAAGEHTVAVMLDVSISAAGIAFPPAGVVGITWTATYYGMVGGMKVLGIETSPYIEYASDPGEALVFSFIVFTGTTMPAQFAKDAFQGAEEEILTYYMNSSKFLNAKQVYDEECGTWYIIEPYYPQFYLDPR